MTHDPRMPESASMEAQGPTDRRVLALRAAAEAKRQETVDATRKAIQGLQKAGVEVTARTLADASGRSLRTILRNKEAYELYRRSASHFKTPPTTGNRPGPKPTSKEPPTGLRERRYDPLMGYSKSRLVQRQRTLEARIEELERELAEVAIRQQQVEEHNLALQAALDDSNARLVRAVSEQVRMTLPLP